MGMVSYLVLSTISVILLYYFVSKKKTDKRSKDPKKCSVTLYLPFLSAKAT